MPHGNVSKMSHLECRQPSVCMIPSVLLIIIVINSCFMLLYYMCNPTFDTGNLSSQLHGEAGELDNK